jgi:hypothetical protein
MFTLSRCDVRDLYIGLLHSQSNDAGFIVSPRGIVTCEQRLYKDFNS